ncbi:MAG: hypothetical protein WAV05_04965 [Anaerolineales bacterium]
MTNFYPASAIRQQADCLSDSSRQDLLDKTKTSLTHLASIFVGEGLALGA